MNQYSVSWLLLFCADFQGFLHWRHKTGI